MISENKVLGVIPARGGSKGIPRKNIRPLDGRPLIAWTIQEAKKSKYIDHLVLSTDDHEIAQIGQRYGAEVPFFRPASLATDTARGIDVVLHILGAFPDFDAVCLLQPTSPFRTVEDIDSAIELWSTTGDTVVGVVKSSKSPYWSYIVNADGRMRELIPPAVSSTNRQELPDVYQLNGAVYVAACAKLINKKTFLSSTTVAYVMPADRSMDLDTEIDWLFAEFLTSRKAGSNES